jgi:hypothetical protein
MALFSWKSCSKQPQSSRTGSEGQPFKLLSSSYSWAVLNAFYHYASSEAARIKGCAPQCRPMAATKALTKLTHGEVSSEPQPLLQRPKPAPKNQWVMVVAPKDAGSGWRGVMRLLRKKLEYPGAVKTDELFPVADSSETSQWVGDGYLLRNLRRTCSLRL